jgi:flagellar protein FliJ
MKWAQSLTRIAAHEVETLQKRLSEITGRRIDIELRRTLLDAEAEAETENARHDAEAARHHPLYMQGWRARRARFDEQIAAIRVEEEGARDALTRAFEEQKKYDHVIELAKQERARVAAKLETAQLDELGLRKKTA